MKKKNDQVYIFHRGDMWYPIELKDDEDAIKNALCNPGTTLVTDINRRVVWEQPKENDKTS